MESVVSTVVIYDSKGERYSSTPEKWTEACRMQRNEKALMEFVENQKHALDFEQVMLFMVKNRLVRICNEDGRPLSAEEISEEIEKANRSFRRSFQISTRNLGTTRKSVNATYCKTINRWERGARGVGLGLVLGFPRERSNFNSA